MIYSDLRELKKVLEIDPADFSEDIKLNFILEHVSSWIEELLNRKFTLQSRTEYYKGTGTQKLLLRARPVFTTPAIQVYQDYSGHYGAPTGSFDPVTSPMIYGTDFSLQIDQEDGSSRSAILIKHNSFWFKPTLRSNNLLSPYVGEDTGSYKIIYTAGYTVDTLPAVFRMATNLLVARLRQLLPLGTELGSESYEDRSISMVNSEKDKLLVTVKPMLMNFRNWHW